MFKNILIPTDGSELSDMAMKNGVAFAKAIGARITGLHVIPAQFAASNAEVDQAILARIHEAAVAEANKLLDRFQADARAGGIEFDRVLLRNDQPWRGIIEAAQEKGCDLILMAAHGRRGLAALVIGSETNKVLTHSKTPVLVYR